MSVDQTPEQFLKQLPSAATLRDKLRQHRDECKVLRRLLKLANEHEATSQADAPRREAVPC